MPPSRKTETIAAFAGPAASATPACRTSRSSSFGPPYTDSASPAPRIRNERRLRPVPAGQRHAALGGRQSPPGLGRGVADERRAREALAVPMRHQQVCRSGDVATRMRSAFWRMIG